MFVSMHNNIYGYTIYILKLLTLTRHVHVCQRQLQRIRNTCLALMNKIMENISQAIERVKYTLFNLDHYT